MENSERPSADIDARTKSRVVEIDMEFGGADHSALGAVVLSYLLVPLPDALTDEKRKQHQDALRSHLIDRHADFDQAWDESAQLIAPADLRRSSQWIARIVRTLDTRLRDRALAGSVALRYAWEIDPSGFENYAPQIPRPSKNALAGDLGDDVGLDGKSVERLMRQSKPVLHLCAGFAHVRQTHARLGKVVPLITGFWDGRFLRSILGAARHFEDVLPASRFGVTAEELIKFRGKNGDKKIDVS